MAHLSPNGAGTPSSPYDQRRVLVEDTERNPDSDYVKTMQARARKNDIFFCTVHIFWVVVKMYKILSVVKCALANVLL